MRYEGAEGDGGAGPFQFVQVLADRSPGPFGRARPFGQSQLRHPVSEPLVCYGRRTHPVRVDEFRGEALEELRGKDGILEGPQSAVGVHVHEAGSQRKPA